MSIPKWKLENDLCRCCHSEGSYVNLAEPRIVDGEIEVYSEMLQECFNIFIAPVSGALNEITYSICENCSNKLRDALSFKHQVLECEKKFENMHSRNCIVVSESIPRVKIEIDISDDEAPEEAEVKVQLDPMADENDDDDGLEDSGNDFLFPGDPDSNSDEDMEIPEKEKQKTPKKAAKTTKKPAKSVQSKNTTKLDKSKPKAKKKKESTADEEDEKEDEKKDGEKKAPVKNGPKFFLRDNDYTLQEDGLMKCTKCEKKYSNTGSLRYHVKTSHYKVPKYVCPYCQTEFMTLAPFNAHKYELHNVDERYHCNACRGVFNTKAQLKKHTNTFHMMGAKYKCDMCEYESFSCESLYKHKFKHVTVKNYHCKFCKKSFLRRATLVLHERIHTGDRRKVCNVCGQAFVQKASLNYHMSKYHPEVTF